MAAVERQLQEALASGLVRRARAGLGGSHTVVTYPPLAALRDAGDGEAVERGLAPVDDLNLYVHVAYCEHVCGFCHYAKSKAEISEGRHEVRTYLDGLHRELARRRPLVAASTVRSIYLGGGTPTILSTPDLAGLLQALADLVGRGRPAFCVEMSPQTALAGDGAEKLALLLAAGVDRISLGVQSFSEALLRRHRDHGQAQVLEAYARIARSGVRLNVDLMQDLPGQDEAALDVDLAWVERLRPTQVTWYIMRPERGSIFHGALRRGVLDICDDLTSARRRLRIREAMAALGYAARSGGRFVLGEVEDSYKTVRSGLDQSLLGFGVSAYSHGWGHFFRNITQLSGKAAAAAYSERLARGRGPIAEALPLTASEGAAAERLAAMRTLLPERLLSAAGPEGDRLAALLAALAGVGLTERHEAGWRLTSLGCAFEEEILSMFYSPAVRAELTARDAYWPIRHPGPLRDLLGLGPASPSPESPHAAATA